MRGCEAIVLECDGGPDGKGQPEERATDAAAYPLFSTHTANAASKRLCGFKDSRQVFVLGGVAAPNPVLQLCVEYT